jgi:lipopolysaccharide export system protein LptA
MKYWLLVLSVLSFPAFAAGPLDVTSDRLEVDQGSGNAVFTGNVVAVRGDLTVTSARTVIDYSGGKKGSGDVKTVTATGNVKIVRKNSDAPDDTATGETAVYNPGTGKLVMTGGTVLLTRGGHTVQGTRLDYDTAAGQAVMQGGGGPDGSGGRVRAHFQSEAK